MPTQGPVGADLLWRHRSAVDRDIIDGAGEVGARGLPCPATHVVAADPPIAAVGLRGSDRRIVSDKLTIDEQLDPAAA